VSLRTRIALTAAVAVALAVILASVATYATTSRTLRDRVDRDLRGQADNSIAELNRRGVGDLGAATPGGRGEGRPLPSVIGGPRPGRLGEPGAFVQLIDSKGNPLRLPPGQPALPVDAAAREVARGGGARFATVEVAGTTTRVLTAAVRPGIAVQIARSLSDTDRTLASLGRRLTGISGAGILLAALLGLIVAERGVRPVTRLTESIEHVARTGDLTHRIAVSGNDEPARLGHTFNDMLANLEQARTAQEQLVADASHELRTPLTALRTNAELLASGVPLDDGERRRVASDVAVQLDAFGRLVGDLVELTRGERHPVDPQPVAIDELIEDAVARARAVHPEATFDVTTTPMVVVGEAAALERAVGALLDNAVIHGGGRVEIEVGGNEVRFRDHGPGIADDDAEKVFARFWRAPDARPRPGSGLGLAIVRQVARAHGGDARIENAAQPPGAVVVLHLPSVEATMS
jgi:two-component system, OmpR family, sensor histidine kinase MprB